MRPVMGLKMPAAVATTRGSLMVPKGPVATRFSNSALARAICQSSPRPASAADACTRPASLTPAAGNPPINHPSRACQRPISPANDHSTATPSDCGTGRIQGIRAFSRLPSAPESAADQRACVLRIAPPERAILNRSSAAETCAERLSRTAAPPVRLPAASASIVISASRHSGWPSACISRLPKTAESRAVETPVAGTRSISSLPREVPATFASVRSNSSAASLTSLAMSTVHWMLDDSDVPAADTSTADEASRASSMRRRSPRAGPRFPRIQAMNGSLHRSCRFPCTAPRSREAARTSSTRSTPSAWAAAASCNCPAVMRTSGRTCSPPGIARAAAARSMSAASAKSSPMSDSAHSHVSPCGRPIRPEASALNREEEALSSRMVSIGPSSETSSGTSQRSRAKNSSWVSARHSASPAPDTMPAIRVPCGCARWPGASGSWMSRRTSASPCSEYSASKRVANTREIASGTRLQAMASSRGAAATGASGDDTDQPPPRESVAVAPAAIVVRSRRVGADVSAPPAGGACANAAARSPAGVWVWTSRPDTAQPASVASARTVPAASSSVIRHAFWRSRSTSSIAPSTTSSSNANGTFGPWPRAANQGASTSSSVLPPRRTSTKASLPIRRTVPRWVGSKASDSSPRSMTMRRTAATTRPLRSVSTTSRYSLAPSQDHVAARLRMRPSMPANAASRGRFRSVVSTSADGASQTSTPPTAKPVSRETAHRRRGRRSPSSVRFSRVAIERSIEVSPPFPVGQLFATAAGF